MSTSTVSFDGRGRPVATSSFDVQVGGDHYRKMKIQPVEFCMANKLDACQSAVIKYVCRFRDKGGRQDLEKAKHYIDLLLELEYAPQEAEKAADQD